MIQCTIIIVPEKESFPKIFHNATDKAIKSYHDKFYFMNK